MAKGIPIPDKLQKSRPRRGVHPELKSFKNAKDWTGKLKDADRYGTRVPDDQTYKKDEAALGKVVDKAAREEQKHDSKDLKK